MIACCGFLKVEEATYRVSLRNPAERPSADALLARLEAFKASHPEEPLT